MLETLVDAEHLENLLLLLELQRQMRGNRVGQAARLVDSGNRGQDFGRDLLVQFYVLIELRDDRAAQRLGFGGRLLIGHDRQHVGGEMRRAVDDALDAGALRAFDQHLDRAIGQLQHLQDVRDAADLVDVLGFGLVLRRVLLRDQHDAFAGFHRSFERLDRLRTADEQRNDHVREDDHVAQRQQRQGRGFRRQDLGRHSSRSLHVTLNAICARAA